ncbi:hypothetical protein SAMN05444722_0402 [Rhodovulum sp. ES.010]|uniref:hypothetical protein n=1 Tax=Rhodovulum sp. ES.010 TaxID=1882821 RepID=UPI0009273A81|nr:hypothetical protein [Rhodovulum sp. ES.010]SIO09648.1 hypothetical protein SAMN05444722_0402 [Rhodovulum sp. ES.010]
MKGPRCDRVLAASDTILAKAGFDPAEQAVLTVARHFFQSFALPKSQAWITAFARAEVLFPPGMAGARAPELALAILGAVQAMRHARPSGFRFSNPDCPGCARVLCAHERHFMEVLCALRRGARSRAHTAAMLICEGNPAAPFLAAMSDLAAMTGTRHYVMGQAAGARADRGPVDS